MSVRALRRLDEKLLCEVLKQFPSYLRDCGLELPDPPERTAMDYEAIHAACVSPSIPNELDDVLYFVSALGNKRGQAQIEREARYRRRRLNFRLDGVGCPDFAMKAWLHDWPTNRDLLEAAYARSQIFSKSSYVYNPMIRDVRSRFRLPTPELLAEAHAQLEDYFLRKEGLGRGANILPYDYPKENWFMVRYPGQVERHEVVDDEGNPDAEVIRPREYDAIVYHKVYGDLRLNTNRKRDHAQYRITFGHLLFGDSNVFDPTTRMVTLEPLRGDCLAIFKADGIEGLAEIVPVEVCFSRITEPGRQTIWRADNDVSLLDHNVQADRLLPSDAHSVRYAKFRYRLSDRAGWERITVHEGQSMTYERDGDCVIVEEWLRRWKFVKNPINRR
jgi:hypothetical protein